MNQSTKRESQTNPDTKQNIAKPERISPKHFLNPKNHPNHTRLIANDQKVTAPPQYMRSEVE
jgi:hypothetical protein